MAGLIESLIMIQAEIAMLKTAFGNSIKTGAIEEVDAQKGYRVKLGETDGVPFLSPWIAHPESGKSAIWLKKGDPVSVVSPSGDMQNATLYRAGYTGLRPSPSDNVEANVFEDAGVRISVEDGALTVTAGGVTFTVSADGLNTTGGQVTHDGKNIGSTHKHTDVTPGAATTGTPE